MRTLTTTLALFAAAALCLPAAAEWASTEAAIMGTSVRAELWHDDPAQGEAALRAVLAEMHRVDARMSTWKDDSEISRINREAGKGPVAIDDEFVELLSRALEFSRLTDGAFDITYSSVGRLYDYRKGLKPSDSEREAALGDVDYRHVLLDEAARTVHFARPGTHIDLGGIAKGYAVERAVTILRGLGVRHAIVTAGGDSRILGDRRGRPWTVGIRDPRDRTGLVTRIPLQDEAISTSGDYERFFESGGTRYHHILTPATGTSPSELRSVSVIGADATATDALSTGVFVLGRDAGLALIESLDAYEAVLIDADGTMHYSSGLMPAQ